MPRSFTRTRPRLILAAAMITALAAPLAACSIPGIPGIGSGSASSRPSTDSKAGDCQVAAETINEVVAEARSRAPELVAAMAAGESVDLGAEFVEPAIAALDSAALAGSDPAVQAAIADARVEWEGLAIEVAELGAPDLTGVDLGNIESLGNLGALQEYGTKVTELVGTRLPALQETGKQLQEACRAAS